MADEHAKKKHKPTDDEAETTPHDEPETVNEQRNEKSAEHAASGNPFQRLWHWTRTHKKFSIPVAILVLLAALAAVPYTRYTLAGTVMKQSFPVVVVDAETKKPISSASVSLNGTEATTNNKGQATLRTNVGPAELTVSKKYYHGFTRAVLVPIGKPAAALQVELTADGRPVPITVLNKISQKPAANVTISAEGTEVKTDKDGKATMVLPAEKKEVKIKLGGQGFNDGEATLLVTSEEVSTNTFQVTPSGKIYFLSNASGKIDLIKSDLDGANRQTVLAGTGKEDKFNTVLLASRDWKYIALLSKRDGGDYAKLFLVETANDKVTTMDEGEATFDVRGWSGDRFVYSLTRQKVQSWEPKRQALKSYSAAAKKITTLAETTAEGPQSEHVYEYFEGIYILDQEIAYIKNWGWSGNAYSVYQGKQATFNSLKADGSQKKTVKSYTDPYIETRTAEFGEIYILHQENQNADGKVDEYHDGKLTAIEQKQNEFFSESYPYYSVSPTGKKTLWSDYRDGKNVFFVGDEHGEAGQQIGASEDYSVYGWYTDEYVLLTRKGSEMHIMPADGVEGGVEKSLKISDYYKPDYNNRGFGYGYGG